MKTSQSLFYSLVFFSMVFLSCSKEEDAVSIIDPSQDVSGKSQKELMVDMTKWVFGNSPSNGPTSDADGKFHQSNQPVNSVFMLAGTLGGNASRSVTVSKSTPLFVPIIFAGGWFYDNDACDPDYKPKAGESDEAFLDRECNTYLKGMVVDYIKLDGKPLTTDFSKYVVKTNMFTMKIHKDFTNPNCDYTSRNAKARTIGYALALKLPKGNYVLEYKAGDPNVNFSLQVSWNITVQ